MWAVKVTSLALLLPLALAGPAKIVGGYPAREGDFPFQVALHRTYYGKFAFSCGGVLLNEDTVLTAGHCVTSNDTSVTIDPTYLQIRAGSLKHDNGTAVGVSRVIIHPEATPGDDLNGYDLAILKLECRLPESQKIGYAKLPEKEFDPSVGKNVVVSGWGSTEDPSHGRPATVEKMLRFVHLSIFDRQFCKEHYYFTTENIVCAEGYRDKSSCFGDSGGPLVSWSDGVLVGIVSGGRECSTRDAPNVFARVNTAREWIEKYL